MTDHTSHTDIGRAIVAHPRDLDDEIIATFANATPGWAAMSTSELRDAQHEWARGMAGVALGDSPAPSLARSLLVAIKAGDEARAIEAGEDIRLAEAVWRLDDEGHMALAIWALIEPD